MTKKEEYYRLKCNFHTHFFESYGNDAKVMVDAYHDAGYDCIALTDHGCLRGKKRNLDVEKEAKAYAEKKYGREFMVILGEELNFKIIKDNKIYVRDMLGLFLDEYIFCGVEDGGNADPSKFITPKESLDKIHDQGGIGIIAHDNATAMVWPPNVKGCGIGEGIWVWDFRKDLPIDGWEIGNSWGCYHKNAQGLNVMLSHPRESVDEGYIVMANSDAHGVKDIKPYGICCTYLFVMERTVNGIKEALLGKKTVAECKTQLFGEQKWLDLLNKITV